MFSCLTLRKLREDIDKVEDINPEYLDLPIFIASESGDSAAYLVNEKFSGNYIYVWNNHNPNHIHLLSDDDDISPNEIPII